VHIIRLVFDTVLLGKFIFYERFSKSVGCEAIDICKAANEISITIIIFKIFRSEENK
jgi:hypothetical protein